MNAPRRRRLSWSNQTPTAPGLYWLKDATTGRVTIRELRLTAAGILLARTFGQGDELEPHLYYDCLWLGPVVPPT